MFRRSVRIGFRLGLLAGIAFALFKLVQGRRASSPLSGGSEWAAPARTASASGRPPGETPLVEPAMLQGVSLRKLDVDEADGNGQATIEPAGPPAKKAATNKAAKAARAVKKTAAKAWVDPKGAFCPSSHPIKGKLSSGIYHLPGMVAYERTTPDRCYHDEDAAQADGLRQAKR